MTAPAVTEADLVAINDAFTPLSRPTLEVVAAIKGEKPTRGAHSIYACVADTCERAGEDGAHRLPFDIPLLDHATQGVERGELVLELGRTGSAKTMRQDNAIRSFVRRHPATAALVVSCEMPRVQRTRRWLRMNFGVTERDLDTGIKDGTLDLDAFCRAYQHVYVLDEGTVTLDRIEKEARLLADHLGETPLDVLFIDHAGLLRGERSGSAYERASQTAIGLKQLARSLDVAIFCVVQANRAGKTDGEPVPLEAARDSGCYEENADFVLAYSGLVTPPDQQPFVKLRLVKNRRGPNATVTLGFDPTTLRMAERTL